MRVKHAIAGCFASSPDTPDVRAAVVLDERIAKLGLAGQGTNGHAVVLMDFNENDRTTVFMEGTVSSLVKHIESIDGEAPAVDLARGWIDGVVNEFELDFLPGIYQNAFWSLVLGEELELAEASFGWVLPPENGLYPVRDFPPRLKPTSLTPVPGEVSFKLLPSDVALQLWYRNQPWRRA